MRRAALHWTLIRSRVVVSSLHAGQYCTESLSCGVVEVLMQPDSLCRPSILLRLVLGFLQPHSIGRGTVLLAVWQLAGTLQWPGPPLRFPMPHVRLWLPQQKQRLRDQRQNIGGRRSPPAQGSLELQQPVPCSGYVSVHDPQLRALSFPPPLFFHSSSFLLLVRPLAHCWLLLKAGSFELPRRWPCVNLKVLPDCLQAKCMMPLARKGTLCFLAHGRRTQHFLHAAKTTAPCMFTGTFPTFIRTAGLHR